MKSEMPVKTICCSYGMILPYEYGLVPLVHALGHDGKKVATLVGDAKNPDQDFCSLEQDYVSA